MTRLSSTLKTLTLLPLAMLPQSAIAGAYTSAAVIGTLNPREYGLDLYVPSAGNPVPCSWSGMFRLQQTAANYQVIASVIITAAAQKKPVQLYAASCDSDGATIIVAAMVATN